ncbi:MAG: hypothetical protein H7A31_00360 [Thermotogae bacterium]|nr:hypothetical protein [Thermotogota bacterium]
MKKLLVISFILTFSMFLFAKTFSVNSFDSNKSVSKNATVKVQVYQWIFADAEGQTITIEKPGETENLNLVKFNVGSNSKVDMSITIPKIPIKGQNGEAYLTIEKLSFLYEDNTEDLNAIVQDNGNYFVMRRIYNPDITVNNDGTLSFRDFRLNADVKADPRLDAKKISATEEGYQFTVEFNFAPTVSFR